MNTIDDASALNATAQAEQPRRPRSDRLQEPSKLFTGKSLLILFVHGLLIWGLSILVRTLLPSNDLSALIYVLVAATGITLAHSLVRAHGSAIVVALIYLIVPLIPLFFLASSLDYVVLALFNGAITLLGMAVIAELCHLGTTQWKPWRSYMALAITCIAGLLILVGPTMYGGLVIIGYGLPGLVIAFALFFGLRQLFAVLEGVGIEGTPASTDPRLAS